MLTTRDPLYAYRLFDGLLGPSLFELQRDAWLAPARARRLGRAPARWPHFDWREEDGRFVFSADLPGLKAADLSVTFDDGVLVVAGERTDATPEGYRAHRRERFAGRFERRFELRTPVEAAEITARLVDGVLTLEVPKAPEAKPLTIEVLGAEAK